MLHASAAAAALQEQLKHAEGAPLTLHPKEREFLIDNLLVRNHFIIVMIRWTGLAPREFESLFPGSLTSTFLQASAAAAALQEQLKHAEGALHRHMGTLGERVEEAYVKALPPPPCLCSGSEAGSYLRLIDFCIAQL